MNSCIQPHAENIWKTPKEVAEYNARATIQNSVNILVPQGNVTMTGASEYISRAQCARKPTFNSGTQYNSPNYKSTTSYDRHTKSGLQQPPHLLTLPTQHATVTHPASTPTHYYTPPPTQYLTTPQTTVPLYPNLPPLYATYPLYNQLILNSYSIPSSASNICTRTPNTLSFFFPHHHPTSIPRPTPQYPGWVPANNTKGHNCE